MRASVCLSSAAELKTNLVQKDKKKSKTHSAMYSCICARLRSKKRTTNRTSMGRAKARPFLKTHKSFKSSGSMSLSMGRGRVGCGWCEGAWVGWGGRGKPEVCGRSVTKARGVQTMHDAQCTTAAKHRATPKLTRSVTTPPTNLPQQVLCESLHQGHARFGATSSYCGSVMNCLYI